jgi:hypothetical protein
MDIAEYKTPPPRLLRLFARSRDTWKRRVAAKQNEIRRLRVRVRDLEASREFWKRRATPPTAPAVPEVARDPEAPATRSGGAPASRR